MTPFSLAVAQQLPIQVFHRVIRSLDIWAAGVEAAAAWAVCTAVRPAAGAGAQGHPAGLRGSHRLRRRCGNGDVGSGKQNGMICCPQQSPHIMQSSSWLRA